MIRHIARKRTASSGGIKAYLLMHVDREQTINSQLMQIASKDAQLARYEQDIQTLTKILEEGTARARHIDSLLGSVVPSSLPPTIPDTNAPTTAQTATIPATSPTAQAPTSTTP